MKEDPFLKAHKPKEDGFPYDLETDLDGGGTSSSELPSEKNIVIQYPKK